MSFRRVYDFFKSLREDTRLAGKHPCLGEFAEELESLMQSNRTDFLEIVDRGLTKRSGDIRNGRHES